MNQIESASRIEHIAEDEPKRSRRDEEKEVASNKNLSVSRRENTIIAYVTVHKEKESKQQESVSRSEIMRKLKLTINNMNDKERKTKDIIKLMNHTQENNEEEEKINQGKEKR